MIGYCSACGASVIVFDKTKKKASAKFAPDFREHYIELSNKTLMRIGLCADCKVYMVSGADIDKKAKDIIKNHIAFWKENSKDAPDNFSKLTVVNPNTNPDLFIRKMDKEAKKKEETVALNNLLNKK